MSRTKTTIVPTTALHPGMAALNAAAEAEGFRFLGRCTREWRSGANRFDAAAECWLGAFQETLVGVCGLNRDPYAQAPGVGRLRHLYVLPTHRGCGVGADLVRNCISGASDSGAGDAFHAIRPRTDGKAAARLYESAGFRRIVDPDASHLMLLDTSAKAFGRSRK